MGLSNIQWTDYTFNPWMGCRKVCQECINCYITSTPPFRFRGMTHGAERVRTSASNWKQPLAWNNKVIMLCPDCGCDVDGRLQRGIGIPLVVEVCKCGSQNPPSATRRQRVFCASLSDWLDDENVPAEWLADLLQLIAQTPQLDWLLLTKRPQNFQKRMIAAMREIENQGSKYLAELHEWILNWVTSKSIGAPPANVWIGVSAGADQATALAIPAKVHFLSCEPMLHALDTTHAARFDWIIFGGESGNKARPCDVRWIRDGLKFCRAQGIAPFVKQLGVNPYHSEIVFDTERGIDGREAKTPLDYIKDSHGGDMEEWPEDLRIREFPSL